MNINSYHCQQVCLVLADDWNTHKARLSRFERLNGEWKLLSSHSVVIGQKGMAWGKGKHSLEEFPKKAEGDGKSPAGIFTFGSVFGVLKEAPTQLPYMPTNEDLFCVDDPKSSFYNQFVSLSNVSKRDWTSAEEMTHELYKWGIVVEHNTHPAEPYQGSCIFFHLWRGEEGGTAGCTAMAENELIDLIFWLDPRKNPLLVQLPYSEYLSKASSWGLP